MRKLPIFVFLLFACSEATIEKCHCFVTISDALPIQFWLTGCDSYNSREKCGVHNACFCAPIQCDDNIFLPFVIESEVAHIQVGDNIIMPSSANISLGLTLPPFDEWSDAGSSWMWTTSPTTAQISLPDGEEGSLVASLAGFSVGRYIFDWDIDTSAGAADVEMTINVYKDASLIGSVTTDPIPTGNTTGTLELDILEVPDQIEIIMDNLGGSSKTILINSLVLSAESIEYTHDFNFIMSELDTPVCDEQTGMTLHASVLSEDFYEWQNIDRLSGTSWIVNSNVPTAEIQVTPGTDWFAYEKAYATGDIVRFVGTFQFTNSSNFYAFRIDGLDDDNSVVFSIDPTGEGIVQGGDTYSFDYQYTINAPIAKIAIRCSMAPPGDGSGFVYVHKFIATGEIAYTDCLDVTTAPGCTVLIEYSNSRNFAGITYENQSPDISFSIRVPAVFIHERFPEEDEPIELPNSLLTLNSTMKAQRLLDTAYMPYYMHRKIQLILMHQFLTIEEQSWVKQDPYEVQEGDRRWPLKKAKCYLSEKNFVQRNIL